MTGYDDRVGLRLKERGESVTVTVQEGEVGWCDGAAEGER